MSIELAQKNHKKLYILQYPSVKTLYNVHINTL